MSQLYNLKDMCIYSMNGLIRFLQPEFLCKSFIQLEGLGESLLQSECLSKQMIFEFVLFL